MLLINYIDKLPTARARATTTTTKAKSPKDNERGIICFVAWFRPHPTCYQKDPLLAKVVRILHPEILPLTVATFLPEVVYANTKKKRYYIVSNLTIPHSSWIHTIMLLLTRSLSCSILFNISSLLNTFALLSCSSGAFCTLIHKKKRERISRMMIWCIHN